MKSIGHGCPTARIAIRWFVFIFVSSLASVAAACPTCKNDLHQSGTEFGFAVSILFMMLTPFCIFAGWTFVILRMRKQLREQDLAKITAESTIHECSPLLD